MFMVHVKNVLIEIKLTSTVYFSIQNSIGHYFQVENGNCKCLDGKVEKLEQEQKNKFCLSSIES